MEVARRRWVCRACLTSLQLELVLNRERYYVAFSVPVPRHMASLKPALLLKQHQCLGTSSTLLGTKYFDLVWDNVCGGKREFLLNRNECYVAFSMPVPSHLTSLQPVLFLEPMALKP